MKILMLATLGLPLLHAAPCLASSNPSVDNAFRLCTVLDATGLLTQECDVSGWNAAVTIKVDVQASEARDICTEVKGIEQKRGWVFEPKWQLKIYSPYSADNTIAVCRL